MSSSLPPGRVLRETYRVESPLGSGGMGSVYAATHLRTGRACAIKVLHPSLAVSHTEIARFRREAEALARLRHPGIVTILDFDVDAGTPFLVMDLVPGETLAQRLAARGALAWDEARRIAREVCDALQYAHDAGVVHRDIKPANILLARNAGAVEHAMLLDFGVAKVVTETPDAQRITATGAILGTPMYVAPEQARGAPVDARCDVYALGAVLYEMVTGAPPFRASNVADLIVQVLTSPAPSVLANARTPVPAALDAVIAASLAKNPSDRPDSARALDAMLAALESHALTPAANPSRAMPAPIGTSASNPALAWQTPATRVDLATAATHAPLGFATTLNAPVTQTPATPSPVASPPTPATRPPGALLAAGAALVVLLGAGVLTVSVRSARPAASATMSTSPQPSHERATPGELAPPGPAVGDPNYYAAIGHVQRQQWRECIRTIRRARSSTMSRALAWSCALNARDYDYAAVVCAEANRDEPASEFARTCESSVEGFRTTLPPE